MNLQIHLIESLLNMQDVLGRHLDQTATVSPKRPHGADESRRSETGTEQADRVEVLKPLAIGDIGLPPRYVLHVLCVDQIDFQASRFQDLGKGNPINAGRLHRHGMNAAVHEPVGQRMQIASEGGKLRTGCGSRSALTAPYNSLAPTSMPAASGCKTGSVSHLLLPFLAICSSHQAGRMPGVRTQNKLPIEIVAGNRQTS